MALPYSIDLTGSGSSIPVSGFGDFGTGKWSNAALPADRWGGSTATTIEFEAQGAGRLGAAQGEFRINIVGDADLTDELETARLKIQAGETVLWEGILRNVDAQEPYVWRPGNAIVVGVLGSGATTITLRFEEPFDAYELAPAFAGAASGAFAASLTHNEVAETIDLAPAFAGTAAGTLAALLTHNEVAETIVLRPAFAGLASGALDIAELVHFMGFDYELAPAFAGTASGALAATLIRREPVDHDLAPAFAGSASGILSALLAHGEVAEAIVLRPAFAGSASGILSALLAHGEVAEAIVLRPAFAGSASGILSALLAHGEVAEAIVLRPAFAGSASGILSALLARGSLRDDFAGDERAAQPRNRILTCAEFRHPDLSAPLRAVNDTEDRVVAGETYTATRFEAKLADDAKRRAPRAEISVGNVGRALSRFVEESGGAAGGTVRLFQVLAVDGAHPNWELTLDIMGITGDSANVRVSLGFDPLLGRPAVALRYDPQTAPGLF